MSKIPIVKVFKSKNGKCYVFWCPFCNTFHNHGISSLGHRGAHCTSINSPYKETGYILKEYSKKEIRELGLSIN